LSRNRSDFEEHDSTTLNRNSREVLAVETLRNSTESGRAAADVSKGEERISVFWRVFGGTLLSIAALVVITVYNQFSSTLTDLRKELNQLYENRAELLRKDEFNNRVSSVWTSVKEAQKEAHSASQGLRSLEEKARGHDVQLDRQTRTAEEDRKDVARKLEEDRRETQRKLEEQRKLAEAERMELTRQLEQLRKAHEDERKELNRDLQALRERLVKVEGRQASKVQPAASRN
jgi:chromosome segregation ATPase